MAGEIPPCEPCAMRIKLKQFRERLGLTLEAMADRSGFSVSQLSRWESGNNNIPSERLPELARSYECRIGDIFEEDDSPFEALGPTLYVKGDVQAGVWKEAWQFAEDEWERYTGRADIKVSLRERFGLRVVGESMNQVYPHGTILDCVAYTGDQTIPNGKRVIVQRIRNGDETETTVKEYHRDADGVEWLVPKSDNPAFQSSFRVDQEEEGVSQAHIIGIVVAAIIPE
ncbi:helix-turn-helix domain-containing protein [Pelagerythrobacter aerophilus]|nr:XRE family transcriptional regulator [Pelagerythrobacter aerophilus]